MRLGWRNSPPRIRDRQVIGSGPIFSRENVFNGRENAGCVSRHYVSRPAQADYWTDAHMERLASPNGVIVG